MIEHCYLRTRLAYSDSDRPTMRRRMAEVEAVEAEEQVQQRLDSHFEQSFQ